MSLAPPVEPGARLPPAAASRPGARARPRKRLAPRTAVALEVARAAGGLALLPWRVLDFLVTNEALRRELAEDLGVAARVELAPLPELPRERPLAIFVSCAEASGELHALHLVRALRSELAAAGAPPPRIAGLGGPRLAAEGVELLAEPVTRAAMGFDGMLRALPYYLGLLERAARRFADDPPDVVVPVDSPALHVPLARIAKRYGLPVVHHVSPQFWAWAPWRASAYRKVVDRTLSILPFEPAWFARRGIPVAHVGHPLLDQLAALPAAPRRPSSAPVPRVLALLPGSREAVIERNLPWMLRAAARARSAVEGLSAVVIQESRQHEERLQRHVAAERAGSWARVECGDLHGSLSRAGAAFTVSGTVLLDLVHQRLPTVVVYRVAQRRDVWMYRHLLSAPYFASVNLILGREVLPEFCFAGDGPEAAIQSALVRCFLDAAWIRRTRDALELAAERLGPPGAAQRAARQVLRALRPPP